MTIRPECTAELLPGRLLIVWDGGDALCLPGEERNVQTEVLMVGGGVAGCAASIALAQSGRRVTLIEREAKPRHKVCGEFLSGEALEDLLLLGIDVRALGAVPIDYVRLAAAKKAAEAPLPFRAASLTRKTLDAKLMEKAIAAGVSVVRGEGVKTLERLDTGTWRAVLESGQTYDAPAAFLATGKHDLRGHTRPKDPHQWIAFKMYYRLLPEQREQLRGASELTLYAGGYGGIQPVEDGLANFCCVVKHRYFAESGRRWAGLIAKMQRDCPHLAMRLAGAEPVLDKPIAITHIPYGFLRRTTEEGLYCIGDQAAVIPSFTGDGVSIALHTARRAVSAYLSAERAPAFQAELRSSMRLQMLLAEAAANGLSNAPARLLLPFCLSVWPGAMRVTARLTRVAQSPPQRSHVLAG